MNDNWKPQRERVLDAYQPENFRSAATVAYRDLSRARRRQSAYIEITPLSEDEVRNLPVAHRSSP